MQISKSKRMLKWTFAAVGVCAVFGSAGAAEAIEIFWDAGTGNWFSTNNWDPAQLPTSADDVWITNGGTAQINAAANAHVVSLGDTAAEGHLQITGGSLTASEQIVVGRNADSISTLTQTGGAVSTGTNVNAGLGVNASGTYTLNAGSLTVGTEGTHVLAVGNSGGTGVFTQNGGTVTTPGLLHVGRGSGTTDDGIFYSNGTYNMNGGTLDVGSQSYIAGLGDTAGVGVFNQTNGNVTFNNRLNVGGANFGFNADGTYNMGGGTLTIGNNHDLWVGGLQPSTPTNAVSGTGRFNHTAGEVTIAGNLGLGAGGISAASDASGEYVLSGGTLRVNASSGTLQGAAIGNAPGSTGTFTQTGGTYIYTGSGQGNLWLGRNGSTGTYNLEGGRLVTPTMTASGAGSATFNWTGGTLATNTIGTGLTLITNDGGTLSPGVSTDIADTNIIGTTTFRNQNSYDQTATGTLAIDIASEGSFDFVSIGETAPGTAQLDGTLDVTLLGGYNPALGMTFDVLRADSITDLGLTVTGLTPSGLGFDTSIVPMSGDESFQVLRLTVVDVPSVVPGDFDGDGDVDGADFVVWQTNFPTQTGATLATGDADGDGDVDGADFVIWQTNFPFTPSPSVAPVPEPGAIILLALGGILGMAGRKLRRGAMRRR